LENIDALRLRTLKQPEGCGPGLYLNAPQVLMH
jgi:hypothetical protein